MYSGHVEKRSKGHYVLIIENGRDNDGKRKRIKESFKGGSREAENELARRITELESGIYVKPSKLTFGEFLKLWLKDYAADNVTDRTYAFYEQMFEIHIIPRLGAIQLDKLKPLHLQQYYTTLKKDGRLDGKPGGLAPSTVAKHHAIIHKALKTAFKWELVAQNISDKVEVPKKKKPKVSFYTSEQANIMLDLAKKTKRYNELLVAVYTGMRRGEIYGLRWQDVDWDNSIINVRQSVQYTPLNGIFFKEPKTESGKRDIKVGAIVMSALKQHRVDQTKKKLLLGNSYSDQDLIFCQDDGRPAHPDTISSWFQKFLADNELPRIRFHDLRHTHITMLLERGVSNIAVAERAGHADPSTPGRIYGHVTVSMRDDAANKIEEAMSRK